MLSPPATHPPLPSVPHCCESLWFPWWQDYQSSSALTGLSGQETNLEVVPPFLVSWALHGAFQEITLQPWCEWCQKVVKKAQLNFTQKSLSVPLVFPESPSSHLKQENPTLSSATPNSQICGKSHPIPSLTISFPPHLSLASGHRRHFVSPCILFILSNKLFLLPVLFSSLFLPHPESFQRPLPHACWPEETCQHQLCPLAAWARARPGLWHQQRRPGDLPTRVSGSREWRWVWSHLHLTTVYICPTRWGLLDGKSESC